MLKIGLAFTGINRKPDSPSVSLFTLASVTPGSSHDIVRVIPSQQYFYLYLPTAYSPKPARSWPALLPPPNLLNTLWPKGTNGCVSQTPTDPSTKWLKDYSQTVLNLRVYETVSDPTPIDNPGGSGYGLEKPIGELEEYAIKENPKYSNAGSDAAALKRLGYDGLGMVRVGQARISIIDLARHYNELTGSGAGVRSTSEAKVTLPLIDHTDEPVERGKVDLTISSAYPLAWNGTELGFANDMLESGEVKWIMEQIPKQTPSFNFESYMLLGDQSKRDIYNSYVESYIKMFPPVTSGQVSGNDLQPTSGNGGFGQLRNRLSYSAISDFEVRIPERLVSMSPYLVGMHAPITSIDGDIYVPMGFYYRRPIEPDCISVEQHQKYLGAIIDMICLHMGTTSEAIARTIHEYLGNGGKTNAQGRKYLTPEMAACLRIFVLFLTHLNTTFRYRSDFSIGSGNSSDSTVKNREDTSNDLLLGLNWEDCDGLDKVVHAISFILLCGVKSVGNLYVTNDPLFRCLERTIFRKYKTLERGPFAGGWTHPALGAFQRLLIYYTPLSLVGATTLAFPNQRDEDGPPRIYIDDLSKIESAPAEEVRKLRAPTTEMGNLDCHRWSILLPIQTVADSLVLCFELEDDNGQTTRYPEDRKIVDSLKEFHAELSQNPDLLPMLPPLLAEGTSPKNAFGNVGASAWLDPSLPESSKIKEHERVNRRISMAIRNNNISAGAIFSDDTWYKRGVDALDEGQCQWLPGDSLENRTSLFYKAITSANIPFFDEFFSSNRNLFTVGVVGGDGNTFGVDVEKVLRPDGTRGFGFAMPIFRIPSSDRQKADLTFGDAFMKWKLPAQLCIYSKLNISLPEVVSSMWSPSQSTYHPSQVFQRQFAFVNARIISDEHLREFESLLKDRTTSIRKSKQKLQPYGPLVYIYSFVPK